MRGRFGAAVVGASLLVGLIGVGTPAPRAAADEMCPPITFEDIQPQVEEPVSEPPVQGEATTTTLPEIECTPFVYDMTYPLGVRGRVISGFGSEREGGARLHKGVDLAAPKLTPVVATRSGRVVQIHNETGSDDCCWLVLKHKDGWQSWYIHLNNDSYETDDGLGQGIRIDLEIGQPVVEGEVLGWVGDSGNAESVRAASIHLHYELRDPSGMAIDPTASLVEAARSAPRDGRGPYLDDDGSLFEEAAALLTTFGIVWSCDGLGTSSCPDTDVTPEDLDAMAEMFLELEVPLLEGSFGDVSIRGEDDPHPFLLEKVLGCDPDVPCKGVTELELTRLASAVSSYRYGHQSYLGLAGDEAPSELSLPTTEEAIDQLESIGAIQECHLPLDGLNLLTREKALYLFMSWIGELEPRSCPEPTQEIR